MFQRVCRFSLPSACLLALLAGSLGCSSLQPRGQADDDTDHVKYDVKTVGDMADAVSNADPVTIGGVGLVTGLEDTGGNPVPSAYLTTLKDQLEKNGVRDVKTLLERPDTSLVLVSALIPPGAHKNDPLDLQVTLPDGSRTTSLRGGVLMECPLYDYESTQQLSSTYTGANYTMRGHILARAKGPLLVGVGDNDDTTRTKQAVIWGGGRNFLERAFYLNLNNKHQHAIVASRVADRINETFQGPLHGALSGTTAKAGDNTAVAVTVPAQYKLNIPRYLRVVRLIPMREAADDAKTTSKPGERPVVPYRQQLAEDLLEPSRCVTAALRLEALGNDSVPLLKHGLTSKHALVRFCAAESLAYLGCPACAEELGNVVKTQPILRAYALTALASLDEAVSLVKLRDLLEEEGPETRYGAFRALRALDEHDAAVQGEFLNKTFWLHRVAPDTSPLVHLSTSRRPEIILFGKDAYLKAPFYVATGDFVVTAGREDPQCTISRRALHERHQICQCSLKLEDVLRHMAEMGAQYPEVVELLVQVDRTQALNCPIRNDALPQAASVEALALLGRQAKEGDLDEEILNVRSELGATPTLFEKSLGRTRSGVERDEEAALHDRRERDHKKDGDDNN